MSENSIQDGKIRKILFNEGALFFGLIGAILSAVFWISNPQIESEKAIIKLEARIEANETIASQLQNIKDNDLHELQRKMDEQTLQLIEVQKSIVRLETLIKQNAR